MVNELKNLDCACFFEFKRNLTFTKTQNRELHGISPTKNWLMILGLRVEDEKEPCLIPNNTFGCFSLRKNFFQRLTKINGTLLIKNDFFFRSFLQETTDWHYKMNTFLKGYLSGDTFEKVFKIKTYRFHCPQECYLV